MSEDAEKYYNKVLKILKQFAPSKNTLLDSRCGEIYFEVGVVAVEEEGEVCS